MSNINKLVKAITKYEWFNVGSALGSIVALFLTNKKVSKFVQGIIQCGVFFINNWNGIKDFVTKDLVPNVEHAFEDGKKELTNVGGTIFEGGEDLYNEIFHPENPENLKKLEAFANE